LTKNSTFIIGAPSHTWNTCLKSRTFTILHQVKKKNSICLILYVFSVIICLTRWELISEYSKSCWSMWPAKGIFRFQYQSGKRQCEGYSEFYYVHALKNLNEVYSPWWHAKANSAIKNVEISLRPTSPLSQTKMQKEIWQKE
jgi:hypothetical protein